MASRDEIVDQIAGFALFADLDDPQLERDRAHVRGGNRSRRASASCARGFAARRFYVILEGEAAVVIDGDERAKLARGDFFGEVSILLGEPPVADIVALRPLRCLVLAGPAVEPSCSTTRRVMYRMLQAQARRLRNANRWRS